MFLGIPTGNRSTFVVWGERFSMINWQWITTTTMAAWMVFVTAIATYFSLLVLTRIAGLRSFAKMSSFDFAITVAIGSLLASILLTKDPPLLQGITALS
ncbi:MAG: hypothetical protein AAF329_28580, partial [Cyanobacteria bacterium P01_A01_bin.17]